MVGDMTDRRAQKLLKDARFLFAAMAEQIRTLERVVGKGPKEARHLAVRQFNQG